MRYPGGKGGAGVYQTIINNIPPHDTYIETHLGGGNILERKRPAARSVGIDVDPEVIEVWQQLDVPGLELHHGDAVAWLESHQFTGSEFVYADPPYVMDSRRGGKLYRHEYDDADHVRLLDVLAGLPCAVMVSGYDSPIYDSSPLATWRTIEHDPSWAAHLTRLVTRPGVAVTHVPPDDPAFTGDGDARSFESYLALSMQHPLVVEFWSPRAPNAAQLSADLKALAKLCGDRKVDTVPLKEVQPLTGYVRGGVTAIGAKKDFPVFVDETIELFDVVSVSAGARGLQLLIAPADYLRATKGTPGPIAK